ncbi:MAG: HypC/HybG/HupF family hydrogenase formation chaperone [Candidatus Dormibacteraeota bacterium]|uniref:HypC/HybG/HupF family hydrogenase formation chaperone n=1 Tax=Candidatus Aeolococcus gillhamiae TaxID=3127015 RepID=A0A2W5Z5H1_9BACT|nr:HypC/HybG/HupF family hydrogenase formation chaperone [Candidatus Dormibacteraeota bacterium]PZR78095.1 MAG: HypC/HybG/HupF family hydrogenase formation chaperone [Candidatus Dormibacter sp. RRmetagenome_bin12]
MCLAIPAKLVEYVDADRNYGKVELGGVRRQVNTSLLVGEDAAEPGDYVLVHVGFALSAISEAEANETLRILEEMGPAYDDELQQIRQSEAMELELVGPDYRKQVTEI